MKEYAFTWGGPDENNFVRKSADVIVVIGNEPSPEKKMATLEVSQI